MNIEAKFLDKILANRIQNTFKGPYTMTMWVEAVVSQSASWTLPLASPLDNSAPKCGPQVFPLTYTLPLDAPN